jgi:hypothetical protein
VGHGAGLSERAARQQGWGEGWGRRSTGADAGGWAPPLVLGALEAAGRMGLAWEGEGGGGVSLEDVLRD